MEWMGKKVLVTGADGFIGSHLVERLVSLGASVRAISHYNSFNNWGWLEDIACGDDIEVISGDIRDPFFCMSVTKDVEVIFHLAALIAIPYSYVAPDSYLETNVRGTLNVCQAARQNGCRKLIHTSTSEVYGTAKYVPINESHPLQPQSPYSASKIGADAIAMSYFYSFGLPVVVARPFNTYGPRQSARAVIPTIITQMATGSKSIMLGDARPTRDFNYVEDTVSGLISLSECEGANGEVVNIGSNFEISVGEVFELIRRAMHSDAKCIVDENRLRPVKSEVERLWCDNTKMKTMTGFVPKVSLEVGLQRTIEWFTRPGNLSKYKAGIYNV